MTSSATLAVANLANAKKVVIKVDGEYDIKVVGKWSEG